VEQMRKGEASRRSSAEIAAFGLRLSKLSLLDDTQAWIQHPDVRGVAFRVLHTDLLGDRFVVLLKLDQGVRLGAADVRGLREAQVVSGVVEVGGVAFAEGQATKLKSVPGTSAVPVILARETTCLLVRGEGLEVLPA
jgi:hypothetical protein